MKIIQTDLAPAAIGPYNQAIDHAGLLFCSGQIALDPATGKMVGDSAAEQARRVLENLGAVLRAGGSNFDRVLKTTIFLEDLGDFAEVNEVYAAYFANHRPARATVAVKTLPRGALVEMDAIAAQVA